MATLKKTKKQLYLLEGIPFLNRKVVRSYKSFIFVNILTLMRFFNANKSYCLEKSYF